MRILLFKVRGKRKRVKVIAYRGALAVEFITDKSFTVDKIALETLCAYKFDHARKS